MLKNKPKIKKCYLCNLPLDTDYDWDHVIPTELFHSKDPHRPKLPVHKQCNNLKSKDDEWFIKQLQFRCSFNKEAEKEYSILLNTAIKEIPDAYIIGKKPRNYIFAKGMGEKLLWLFSIEHNGQTMEVARINEEDSARFEKYIRTMCRGLFIKNIPFSNPKIDKLTYKSYPYLELKGGRTQFINKMKDLFELSKTSRFGQKWKDRILYFGSRVKESPDKGFVFIELYSQFAILAWFK